MKKIFLAVIFMTALHYCAFSQNQSEQNSEQNIEKTDAAIEKIRTQSGIDPTRVTTRAGYSFLYYIQPEGNAFINNRLALNLGINRWSFSIKPDISSTNIFGDFRTKLGDIRFTILNAFYVKNNVALAGSVDFGFPTGDFGFGMQYFTCSPAITLSYTVTPQLFFAVQPQYSFSFAKNHLYPYPVNALTVRVFGAYFTKNGYFFVLEPRPICNFENGEFDLIIAPLIGKALGAGYNLILLSEIPTRKATIDNRGVLVQLGFNKNF